MDKHEGDAAIRIKNHYAPLYAARLDVAGSVTDPDAPFVHLFVARGDVELEGAGRWCYYRALPPWGIGLLLVHPLKH